jgi:hypothetical protein
MNVRNPFCEAGLSPPQLERFVSADEAAVFLAISRRYLLALARRGLAGAYALGTGTRRKIWVFRLSELAAAIARSKASIPVPQKCVTIQSGSLRAEKRKQ